VRNRGIDLFGTRITPIIDLHEIESIESSIDASDPFAAPAKHMETAILLYGDRKNPDYRNSIREAISAVESTVKIIAKDQDSSLGEALKRINSLRPVHPALKSSLLKLYGYASDEKGIRHALLEEGTIDEADARFMIVACSAFVNYLKSRTGEAHLK
jgi:hypothetical protein